MSDRTMGITGPLMRLRIPVLVSHVLQGRFVGGAPAALRSVVREETGKTPPPLGVTLFSQSEARAGPIGAMVRNRPRVAQ